MFWSSPSKRSGFTLIELLLTTALSLVLIGGVIASFSNFSANQSRVQAARQVMSLLRRAQERSRAGDKPASGCTRLNGYRVRAVVSTQNYVLSLLCDSSGIDKESEVFTLQNPEYFQTGFDLLFSPNPGPVSGAPVTIKIGPLTGGTNHFEIQVEVNGVLTDKGLVTN